MDEEGRSKRLQTVKDTSLQVEGEEGSKRIEESK
jgi:hypothetical protein